MDSRTADKFVIRLPDGWRDKLAKSAKENHRSMNQEILHVLGGYLGETVPVAPKFKLEEAPSEKNPTQDETWTPSIGLLVEHPGGDGTITAIFRQRGQVVLEIESNGPVGRERTPVILPAYSCRPLKFRVCKTLEQLG